MNMHSRKYQFCGSCVCMFYLSSKLLCGNFEEECSICQDNMVEGNTALKLTCRHAYHADCVQMWLEKHNTCPLCRNEMPRHKGPKKMSPGGVDRAVRTVEHYPTRTRTLTWSSTFTCSILRSVEHKRQTCMTTHLVLFITFASIFCFLFVY